MHSDHRLLLPFLNIVRTFLWMSLRAACFAPVHTLLPAKLRLRSCVFGSVFVLYALTALLRHIVVEHADPVGLLKSIGVYTAFLFLLARGKYINELALALLTSAGVDILCAAAGVAGFDMVSQRAAIGSFVWEAAATAVVILRYHLTLSDVEVS
jgi:hypothetical protein